LARQRALSLRNDHLQYALTWFALAVGLLVVYVLFRREAERARR
jgi:surfeit locus 1 family protein